MKKKILFIITEDWYFISHRLKLAKYLRKKGFEVSVCCRDTGKINDIKKNGIDHYPLSVDRKSLSIIKFFYESISIIKTVRVVNPDIVHLISMRPIIIGIISSFFVNSRFCATFTGMGFLFIKNNFKFNFLRKIIIIYLRFFLKFKNLYFIVQNKDDKNYFKSILKLKKNNLRVIRGSGIDINYFKYHSEKNKNEVRLAYAGRILKDKGVLCLIEAYKIAKAKNASLSLYIAGSLDGENPSSISKKHFNQIIKFKDIYYLGKIYNIKKYWQEADIAVLLSKREGLPLSLLEAASIGRPIISTDVTGSREIAINNYNAINVKVGDVFECSKAIIKLSRNKTLRKKYGKNSRKLVESDMALDHICHQYYSLYREIIC